MGVGRKVNYGRNSSFLVSMAKSDSLPLYENIYKTVDLKSMKKLPTYLEAISNNFKQFSGSKYTSRLITWSFMALTTYTFGKLYFGYLKAKADPENQEIQEKREWVKKANSAMDSRQSRLKELWTSFYASVDETIQWDLAVERVSSPLRIDQVLGINKAGGTSLFSRFRNYANGNELFSRLDNWNWSAFCLSPWQKVASHEQLAKIWCPSPEDPSKIVMVTVKDEQQSFSLLKALHGKSKTTIVRCGDEKDLSFQSLTKALADGIGISIPFATGFTSQNLAFDEFGSLGIDEHKVDWRSSTFFVMNFYLKLLNFVKRADEASDILTYPSTLQQKPDILFKPALVLDFSTLSDSSSNQNCDPNQISQVMFVIKKFMQGIQSKNLANCIIIVPEGSALAKVDQNLEKFSFQQGCAREPKELVMQ